MNSSFSSSTSYPCLLSCSIASFPLCLSYLLLLIEQLHLTFKVNCFLNRRSYGNATLFRTSWTCRRSNQLLYSAHFKSREHKHDCIHAKLVQNKFTESQNCFYSLEPTLLCGEVSDSSNFHL